MDFPFKFYLFFIFFFFKINQYIIHYSYLKSIKPYDEDFNFLLSENFWDLNTYNNELNTPSEGILNFFFPLLNGKINSFKRIKNFKKLFLTLSFWLILIQILFFIFLTNQNLNPINKYLIDSNLLLKYGSIYSKNIFKNFEIWRFITTNFLHGNLQHLFINILIEFIFILNRESSWKFFKTFLIFFLSSISGSILSMSQNINKISIGSSSGIYGIIGSYISIFIINFFELNIKIKLNILIIILIIIISFIFLNLSKQIDTFGHLGGILFGLFIGFLLFYNNFNQQKYLIYFSIIGIILILLIPLIQIIFFNNLNNLNSNLLIIF